MALLREESAEKASPEKITSAIGDSVEQALVKIKRVRNYYGEKLNKVSQLKEMLDQNLYQ